MLKTCRCILMRLQQTDFENVKKLYENEEVRKYLGGTIDEQEYLTKFSNMLSSDESSLIWVINHSTDNNFIGLISLDSHHDGVNTEVSYQLLPKYWGQGYATEVVCRVIDYAIKELGLTKVVAETQTANKASCKLLKKLGMKLEQTIDRFGAEQAIFSVSKH